MILDEPTKMILTSGLHYVSWPVVRIRWRQHNIHYNKHTFGQ